MNAEAIVSILAASARNRKITALVIGKNFALLRGEMFDKVIKPIDSHVLKAQRGYHIQLANGTLIVFMTPESMQRRLPGLSPDFVWLNCTLNAYERQYLMSRTLLDIAVVLES